MRLVGTASRELVAARLRDAEAEAAAAAGRGRRRADRDELAARAGARRGRETPRRRRRRAARARRRRRAPATSALDARGGARARGGRRDGAARLAGRCERSRGGCTRAGAPTTTERMGSLEAGGPGTSGKSRLWYLHSSSDIAGAPARPCRATQWATTWTSRRRSARACARGTGCRLRFPRTCAELFGGAFPKSTRFPKLGGQNGPAPIIEYAHAGAYYGRVTPSAVTSSPTLWLPNVKDVKDVKDGTRAPNKTLYSGRGVRRHRHVGGVDRTSPSRFVVVDRRVARRRRRRAARRGARARRRRAAALKRS